MIYLITHGEYSDYDHDAIIEVDAPLDLDALKTEYRQAMVKDVRPDFGDIHYDQSPPYDQWRITRHSFDEAHFVDWLVANHGARRLPYTELNIAHGGLSYLGQAEDGGITEIDDEGRWEIANVAGFKTRVFFGMDERKHGDD